VLIGLGAFALLAPIGFFLTRRGDESRRWRSEELALWAAVNVALLYLPISFQRRLMEGLQFPLALLSGFAFAAIFARLRKANAIVNATAGVALLAIFLPTSFYVVLRDTQANAARDARSFFSADEAAALTWIRESTPRDAVVLTSLPVGNDVIGWGERTVYVGHWSQTVDIERKAMEAGIFFANMRPERRSEFVLAHGIGYVLEGPAERAFGGTLMGDPGFVLEFQEGAYAVYSPRK
jgi:hypothetical protein